MRLYIKYRTNSDMNKRDLKKLTKAQLIRLLLKQEKNGQAQKQIANEFENSMVSLPKQEESLPRKSVNNYEPPGQFQGKHKKQKPPKLMRPPPPKREHEEPSSKIKELSRALKGHAKSYKVEIQDNLNPLNHLTKRPIKNHERVQIH